MSSGVVRSAMARTTLMVASAALALGCLPEINDDCHYTHTCPPEGGAAGASGASTAGTPGESGQSGGNGVEGSGGQVGGGSGGQSAGDTGGDIATAKAEPVSDATGGEIRGHASSTVTV